MKVPRHPVTGIIYLAMGGISAGVLTFMLTWTAMVLLAPEEALAWGTAVTEHLSNLRGAAAERWAKQYVNPGLAGMLILFSIIPLWFARQGLAFAYTNLLPLGVSQDGLMHVEFAEPPRIGGHVRGLIVLGHKRRPGETFALKLSCVRQEPPVIQAPGAVEWDIVDVHVETREATAELVGGRWVLPFDFEVPALLPYTPHGLERVPFFLSMERKGPAAWAIQATDGSGDHEIEFDMGRPKVDPLIAGKARVAA